MTESKEKARLLGNRGRRPHGRQEMKTRFGFVLVLTIVLMIGFLTAPARPNGPHAGSDASSPAASWSVKSAALASRTSAPTSPLDVGSGAASGTRVGPNVDVSNEPGPQSETSIAINPANPNVIVAGSNEIFRLPMRAYFSSDAGKNWGGVDLPLPPPTQPHGIDFGSDPGVAWDTLGNVYYSYIVVFFSKGFKGVVGTEMAVARSSDGGQTWTATFFDLQTGSSKFNDKPMISVDTNPGSAFLNRIYVAWDAASGSPGIQESSSGDHGVTFSSPVSAGIPKGIGADPFVGPDGTLYVAWQDFHANQELVSRSTDGGASFGSPAVIATTLASFDVAIPAQAFRHALIYPACGADASAGPNRGTLYCSWTDETPANGMDAFVAHSTDGGITWSSPVRANDDPAGVANDQFNQWLAVDPADGSVSVSFYDTRNDPTHVSTDVYYARSTDGGNTFGANVKVTTAPTNEAVSGADFGNQYGDYEGIAALNGAVHPVWTDRRASVANVPGLDEEVFTATITIG
jgi:hypothetical protein